MPAAASAADRIWRHACGRRAMVRSMGASRTWRTSAASNASGPPWPPERNPMASTTAMARPIQGPPCTPTRATAAAPRRVSPTTPDSSHRATPARIAAT